MTKVCTHGRDKALAVKMLEESLHRLQTDHLDLWEAHGMVFENDPALFIRPNGAAEALDLAKKQGKVRFVGFTGHKDPRIHLKMLSHKFPFDTVQMPLNCFDGTYRSFEQHVIPELNRQGIAPLGMKSFAGTGEMLRKGAVTPVEALSYAMSLPVAVTISGVDTLEVLHQNLGTACGFKALEASAMQALREQCRKYSADGRLELFKMTVKYDGKIGREQHGYQSPEDLPL
jgi:aryl-alcohol dehydrogenase-like predicted oxidoreductase